MDQIKSHKNLETFKNVSLNLDIKITGRLKIKDALENIANAEIGIMINSSKNSTLYSTPLH